MKSCVLHKYQIILMYDKIVNIVVRLFRQKTSLYDHLILYFISTYIIINIGNIISFVYSKTLTQKKKIS